MRLMWISYEINTTYRQKVRYVQVLKSKKDLYYLSFQPLDLGPPLPQADIGTIYY